MYSINKTFLASDPSKLIPFQMLKFNYGYSSDLASEAKATTTTTNSNPVELSLVFPSEYSFAVMLINASTQELTDIEVSPPGVTNISLKLVDDESYWVFIISKDYEDGFLSVDGNIIPPDSADERLLISSDTVRGGITQLEPNYVVSNELSPSKWYNYSGFYTGDLIWQLPEGADSQTPGNYSYLIYYRDVVSDVKELFERYLGERPIFDIDISEGFLRDMKYTPDFDNPSDVIRILELRDNVNRYVRSVRNSNAAIYEQDDIQNFFDNILSFTNDNHADGNLANFAEAFLMLIKFGSVLGTRYDTYKNQIGTNTINYRIREDYYEDVYTKVHGVGANVELVRQFKRVTEFGDLVWNQMYGAAKNSPASYARNNNVTNNETELSEISEFVFNVVHDFWEAPNGPRVSFNLQTLLSDALGGTFGANYEDVFAALKDIAIKFYNSMFPYVDDTEVEVDSLIRSAGDYIFTSGFTGDTGTTVIPLAHEAVLQNIRYLKNLMNTVENDIWMHVTNSNVLVYKSIRMLNESLSSADVNKNTIVGLTDNFVDSANVDVAYTLASNINWKTISTPIRDVGNNVKMIDISFIQTPGRYLLKVYPKILEIGITDIVASSTISTPDLNDYQAENYFHGWNIEFYEARTDGKKIGSLRTITSSFFTVNDHRLVVSPSIAGQVDYKDDVKAKIWSNDFVPILIDVDITLHNAETLSYASYAKEEFNIDTGLLTLYDYAGNIYKQWTIGHRALEEEGYNDIKYRIPTGSTI